MAEPTIQAQICKIVGIPRASRDQVSTIGFGMGPYLTAPKGIVGNQNAKRDNNNAWGVSNP